MPQPSRGEQYVPIIKKIFADNYRRGATRVDWVRKDISDAADALGLARPGNLGDVPYAFRFRRPLPDDIMDCAPKGKEWVIRLTGRGKYAFQPVTQAWFFPNPALAVTKIPDATPAIITTYALNDEQAVLAILRYNRLVDIFAGVTCYSLQNHLRTTVSGVGQIETDEVYLGVDVRGAHYLIPVQAKGKSDNLSVVQIEQDFALARKSKFKNLIPRPMGAQFIDDGQPNPRIALFEFEEDSAGEILLAREKHYRLVPSDDVSVAELVKYGRRPFD